MRTFIVCIHDATPAYARETRTMIRELAPLTGRRLAFGVVPDWHGQWPLASHSDYCRLLRDASDELLLHGCFHRRQRGRGLITALTGGSDEMNGLDADATRRLLERGQRVLADVFGEPARGFLAPAWQPGHVRALLHTAAMPTGLEYLLGFFSLESSSGRNVPLSTWTWDCGRWAWPGHVGHGIGALLHTVRRGVPVLAIHPADLERGYWPRIVRLARELIERGYEPGTLADLLEARDAEVVI